MERKDLVYQAKINLRDAIRSLTLARDRIKRLNKRFLCEKIDYMLDRLEKLVKSLK